MRERCFDTQLQELSFALNRLTQTLEVDSLLELQGQPLGFRPDELCATRIQVWCAAGCWVPRTACRSGTLRPSRSCLLYPMSCPTRSASAQAFGGEGFTNPYLIHKGLASESVSHAGAASTEPVKLWIAERELTAGMNQKPRETLFVQFVFSNLKFDGLFNSYS